MSLTDLRDINEEKLCVLMNESPALGGKSIQVVCKFSTMGAEMTFK